MFASLVAIALNVPSGLPDGIKKVLESHLPAWSQMTGDFARPSESDERIAVERTDGANVSVWLIERKIKVSVLRDGANSWLTDVVWCGQGEGRCDDVWKRTDAQWRSDNTTANHTGYAVYRDSLRMDAPVWSESVPSLETGKKKWDKGLCAEGLCFLVAIKDSSVARAAVRPNGSVAWWDGGYIKGGALEKEQVHVYKELLRGGLSVKGGK